MLMKKTKLNTKREEFQKKTKENPKINQKEFQELLRRAVQPSKSSPKRPD